MARLTVAKDEWALVAAAAARLTALIESAIEASGVAMVSLTGGHTPRALYSALADPEQPWRGRIDWSRVHLFWGDERHVPPDDPESNYRLAKETLIDEVPIPSSHVHRMRGELTDAHDAAVLYDTELSTAFDAAGHRDRAFDVMLLGLGDDAHIASIFPGGPLSMGGADRVASQSTTTAVWAPHLNAWRITLRPATILESRAIVLYVAGPGKADAVHAAIEAPLDVERFPAQMLRQAGERVEWFMDAPAAGRLHGAPPA